MKTRVAMRNAVCALILMAGCPALLVPSPVPAAAEEVRRPARAAPMTAATGQPHRPKTLRALIEEAVLLTASTLDYWSDYGHFTVDWEFTWRTLGRKFFTAQSPKFDSNAFWYNWSHAGAGGGYYSMARTNGFSSRTATLFSFVSSTLWETFSEWRELVSVNDMLFSTFGGPAIAEPLFQLSSYFSHRKGLFARLASFVTDPFLGANNWFDQGDGPDTNSDPDPTWHRFRLFAGFKEDKVLPAVTTAVDQAGAYFRQFELGLDTETISVLGYRQDEAFGRFLPETSSSRILIDTSFSAAGLEEIRIRTQAELFGYAWQEAGADENGVARGVSGFLGYSTAFEMFRKRSVAWYDSNAEVQGGGLATTGFARFDRPTPARFTDKLAVISPLGAVFRLGRFAPGVHLRWTAEAHGDFAMVNALAYNRFTETHDPGGVKSTLLNWGYYYGLGVTLASDVAADLRRWRFQAGISCQWYDSVQGQDRYQYLGLVTDDFRIRDTFLRWRVRLGYHLSRLPLELGVAAEGLGRQGRLLDIKEHYHENRVSYQLAVVF